MKDRPKGTIVAPLRSERFAKNDSRERVDAPIHPEHAEAAR
jgi:hypothetical protein